MPNWAKTRIDCTGDDADKFAEDFNAAFEAGRIGDEGASWMAGKFRTNPDGVGNGPRACWDLEVKKLKVGPVLLFSGKWRCCFEAVSNLARAVKWSGMV